jgi:4-hydroxy 2-oxovalerate aldolase
MKLQALDCTLRDGGYYLNWDFDENLVKKYISSVTAAKIDIVEIGFRFLSEDKFMGAFAFSTDSYLDTLNLPKSLQVSVMINASELIKYKEGISGAVNYLFDQKDRSPVDIVRIATKASDIDNCAEIAEMLNHLGYRVFINIMQIDSIEKDEISKLSKKIASWLTIEVFYFADSFGNMNPQSVVDVMTAIKRGWDGPIGIHTHDNKELALSNSMAAADFGANFIDSTISGIGRGAGNAKTEYLLIELVKNNYGNYFYDALFPIALQEFDQLQKEYNWGSNIYYYLSASYGIHPTYIQEMLSDERYGIDSLLSAINFLKSSPSPSFSVEKMNRAASGIAGDENGAWSSSEWLKGKAVLILGSGPGTKKYIEPLKNFIKKHKPIVLCLNINEEVPVDIVDAYVACHETRILIESDKYEDLKKPIIMPLSRVSESINKKLQKVEILDFGLRIQEGVHTIADNGCILNSPLALAYAISIATAGCSSKLYLAGFDGYETADPRQLEMVKMLKNYKEYSDAVQLIAITPTTYSLDKISIFAKKLA